MYLGVDESNHGKFPEIFAACISNKKNYAIEREFNKIRSSKKRRYKLLADLNYKHIIFTKDFGGIINSENYKTIAIGEFSRFYSKFHNLEKVFMDGPLPHKQAEKVMEMLYGIDKNIEFRFGIALDKKIKLVNQADNLANFLFRYYRDSPEENKTKYFDNILHPSIRDYERFLI